jgi:hypothetical protein
MGASAWSVLGRPGAVQVFVAAPTSFAAGWALLILLRI